MVSIRLLNGRRLFMPASANRIRMVSLDTTEYLEGDKQHEIDASGYFDADVASLIIVRSSPSFVFLDYPGSPQRLTLPFVILSCQFRPITISLRPRLRPIRLFDQPASVRCTIQPLLLSDNYLYCRRLRFRSISCRKTFHPSRKIHLNSSTM